MMHNNSLYLFFFSHDGAKMATDAELWLMAAEHRSALTRTLRPKPLPCVRGHLLVANFYRFELRTLSQTNRLDSLLIDWLINLWLARLSVSVSAGKPSLAVAMTPSSPWLHWWPFSSAELWGASSRFYLIALFYRTAAPRALRLIELLLGLAQAGTARAESH